MSDIIWGTVTKIITINSFEMNVSHQKIVFIPGPDYLTNISIVSNLCLLFEIS